MTTLFGPLLATALMAQFQGARSKAPSSTTGQAGRRPRSSFMLPLQGRRRGTGGGTGQD